MRVVLDTNILVRANPRSAPTGLARDLLLALLAPPNVLIASSAILAEVARVLRYSHVQERWPLTGEAIETYVGLLQKASFMVMLPSEWPQVVRDPDDDPILQTAIEGRADVLCSRDAAFRAAPVERVCREHGIRVLDDVTLRHELRLLHAT